MLSIFKRNRNRNSQTTRKSEKGSAGRILKLENLFAIKGGMALQDNDGKDENKEE